MAMFAAFPSTTMVGFGAGSIAVESILVDGKAANIAMKAYLY